MERFRYNVLPGVAHFGLCHSCIYHATCLSNVQICKMHRRTRRIGDSSSTINSCHATQKIPRLALLTTPSLESNVYSRSPADPPCKQTLSSLPVVIRTKHAAKRYPEPKRRHRDSIYKSCSWKGSPGQAKWIVWYRGRFQLARCRDAKAVVHLSTAISTGYLILSFTRLRSHPQPWRAGLRASAGHWRCCY